MATISSRIRSQYARRTAQLEGERDVTNDAAKDKRRPARGKPHDLTAILAAWEFDEEKSVRRIKAEDGRDVIQVRLPLGLEQYEIDGRPDGKRPMNQESWLHYYWGRAKASPTDLGEDSGDVPGTLSLSDEDFCRLEQEGLLYYYRYLLFFQIHEYRLCARDTRRNLKLLDFVAEHAPAERAQALEQYRPYILRMNHMARALFKIQENEDIPGALKILHAGLKAIEALRPIPGNHVFEVEKVRSLKSLEDLISQLQAHVPRHMALENDLQKAIREENYERAAVLRDELAELKRNLKQ